MTRISAENLQKMLSSDIRTKSYMLGDRIGSGGFADVYRINSEQMQPGSTVLKVIDVKENFLRLNQWHPFDINGYKHFLNKSEREFRLFQEIYQKNTDLSHLVNIEEALEISVNDNYYILLLMPYFPANLDIISELMPFNETFVIEAGIQCAKGLVQLQEHGIIHRDIKPDNIFFHLENDKIIFQISDYGLCCSIDEHTAQAKATSTFINTKFFAAPEAIWGQYSFATDIYSLGMTLYWLCNDYYKHFSDHLNILLKQPDCKLPKMKHGSDGLWKIVQKATAFNPKNRYQNAQEILTELQSLKTQHKQNAPEVKLKEIQSLLQIKQQEISRLQDENKTLQQKNDDLVLANTRLQQDLKKQQEISQLENKTLQQKNDELVLSNTRLQQDLKALQELVNEEAKADIKTKQTLLPEAEDQISYPQLSVALSKREELCYHGYLHALGLGVPKDFRKAKELYQASYELGYAQAAYQMGLLYLEDNNEIGNQLALSWLKTAVQMGHETAMLKLADSYQYGWYGLKKDIHQAKELLEKAVQLNNTDGMIYLATMLSYGPYEDLPRAKQLYEQAIAQGNQFAMYRLAREYTTGLNFPKNVKEALRLLHQIIDMDHSSYHYLAYQQLGELYEKGEGIPKNIDTAIKYYRLAEKTALEQENSQLCLFTYGPNNIEIPLRSEQIFTYYKNNYNEKKYYSIYKLGVMYELGIGVPKNDQKARELYEKSAALNKYNDSAYARLGLFYETQTKDIAKAEEYYQKATYNTFAEAKLALMRLNAL